MFHEMFYKVSNSCNAVAVSYAAAAVRLLFGLLFKV